MLEPLFAAVAEALFGYLLRQSDLAGRAQAVLRLDPKRRAFQTALGRACAAFAGRHPEWTASLFDEAFLTSEAVLPLLAELLTPRGRPDPADLARRFARHLGHPDPDAWPRREAATRVADDFLHTLEAELAKEEALRPLYDSRALERIAENAEAIRRMLEEGWPEALAGAERAVRIAGDVRQSVIVTGDYNTVNYFVAPAYALPTNYSSRVRRFLEDYLGVPGRPVPFGGREADLRALSEWLEDPAAPPYLLLTAPAGRGKTALLVRWSAALQARKDLRVIFVPVSIRYGTHQAAVTFALLAGALAQAHGKPPPTTDQTPEMWRGLAADTLRRPLPSSLAPRPGLGRRQRSARPHLEPAGPGGRGRCAPQDGLPPGRTGPPGGHRGRTLPSERGRPAAGAPLRGRPVAAGRGSRPPAARRPARHPARL
ncbi:MAG: hypothetical protein ACP5ME_05155 [Anaerolineae bacterium]